MGSTNATRKFEFTAPISVRRNLAGDGQDSTILQGRVGNTSSLTGKLLGVYTNSGTDGGDAINYYGKTDGTAGTNIQTKNSVEALIAASLPDLDYKITKSGDAYFIESI